MQTKTPDPHFLVLFVPYFLFLGIACLVAGALWGWLMMVLAGYPKNTAVVGGIGWGISMWVTVGVYVAYGMASRRTAEFPAMERKEFREVVRRTCRRLWLVVLSESEDELILVSKIALFHPRAFAIRVTFEGEVAVLSAPYAWFKRVQKELRRILADSSPARD